MGLRCPYVSVPSPFCPARTSRMWSKTPSVTLDDRHYVCSGHTPKRTLFCRENQASSPKPANPFFSSWRPDPYRLLQPKETGQKILVQEGAEAQLMSYCGVVSQDVWDHRNQHLRCQLVNEAHSIQLWVNTSLLLCPWEAIYKHRPKAWSKTNSVLHPDMLKIKSSPQPEIMPQSVEILPPIR